MQSMHVRNRLSVLAGSSLFVLSICASQSAIAADGTFTDASLQGSYAYVNNNGSVASLGPMTFDGNGGAAYASASGSAISGGTASGNALEQITNGTASGGYHERFPALVDRVPPAFFG
jgi:hypothetical protein